MDKFTVDLDQVLNDFEYYELTDQQSKKATEKNANPSVPQDPPGSRQAINNVFNSLDEYLNSEIGISSDKLHVGDEKFDTLAEKTSENDNNTLVDVQEEEHSNKHEEGAKSLDQNILINVSIPDETLGQNERLVMLNNDLQVLHNMGNMINELQLEKNVENLEYTETFKDQVADKDNVVQVKNPLEFAEETDTNLDSGQAQSTEKTETNHLSMLDTEIMEAEVTPALNCTENVIRNVNIDKECDKKIDKSDSIDEQTHMETKDNQIENNLYKSEEIVNEGVNSIDNYQEITEKVEKDSSVDNLDELKCQEDFVIELSESPYALGVENMKVKSSDENSTSVNDSQHIENDKNVPEENVPKQVAIKEQYNDSHISNEKVSSDDLTLKNNENRLEGIASEQDTSEQKMLRFTADIDIDVDELHRMLEDLEIEQELGEIRENVGDSDVKTSEGVSVKTSDAEVEESLGASNENESKAAIENDARNNEKKSNAPILECLEVEKPKTKSVGDVKKEISENQELPAVEILECLEVEKPKIVEKTSDCDFEEGASENQEARKSLQKQQSQDCLNRPQDLPLKNEPKEETTARKIDLIGSPGSTPYNNVYINKSIEPKTDIDSDYTSSASPTFSDCSTESTSTASTASVEDVPRVVKNSDRKKKGGGRSTDVKAKAASGDGLSEGRVDVSGGNPEDGTGAVADETSSNVASQEPAAEAENTSSFLDKSWLGKEAPLWVPDADAATCLHCDMKFTVLKRRHHCRACGLVLCSKCCNLKYRLEYLDAEARVCNKCFKILSGESHTSSGGSHQTPDSGDSSFRPNPNNPLEYCSTVSPLQQIGPAGAAPPSVMVPVGVLKRKGSNKKSNKSVMFCDGIAPGSDLTNLDQDFDYNGDRKRPRSPQKVVANEPPVPTAKPSRNQPKVDPDTGCFIPKSETSLPPTVSINKTDILYSECSNAPSVVEMLKNESLTFSITQNLFVNVKVINMSCCVNKLAWCFSTEGLMNVGSDEVVYLIEYIDEESFVPKDVFFHIYNIYLEKGTSIKEFGLSLHNTSNFLDSKNHAGFIYIRPSFQCLENVLKPKEPYLIGILIHRWETPWAKLFPLRLVLRLGAEYRYYPSPLISTRHRDSVFVEIGNTIINLLADFRNFTYSLPEIRGLIIHMEDKNTTITIPRNRYEQVMKSINNSSEHILAFAGNFSPAADSHLVCIQNTEGHENLYTTHAINIHNKPRKITGASFIVFNGSLKSTSGLVAKSNIVEDGLMIQIPAERMEKIRDDLRNMRDHTIACGCINSTSDETVNIVWGENDLVFNVGVRSPVDLADMKGVPSIRVHNGKHFFCNNGARFIRWTEVFILQNGEEETARNQDPVDISKVSESIAKACCKALVQYLDLLVSNSCQKIGIRANLHVENVSYSAGSNGLKLPPIYMKSLDNELIPVLHKITSNNVGDSAVVLELIFRILNA